MDWPRRVAQEFVLMANYCPTPAEDLCNQTTGSDLRSQYEDFCLEFMTIPNDVIMGHIHTVRDVLTCIAKECAATQRLINNTGKNF